MSIGDRTAILEIVASGARRRPSAAQPPALEELFHVLAACSDPDMAESVEQRIWSLWMYHPHRRAARHLDCASTEIATHCHDIAETRLIRLVRGAPCYAEAWNKLATLYYLQERDAECLDALHHVLELEPRHFGAICSAAEIFLSQGDRDEAAFAFEAALRIHPHLGEARQRLVEMH